MKKIFRNIFSAAALLMLTATAAFADGDGNNGVVAEKTVTDNGDGTYTLTLEAYATGEGTATTETVSQPLDIVLVLDMSGSMDNDFSDIKDYYPRPSQAYSYTDLRNKTYYYKHTDGVYYKLSRGYDSGGSSNPKNCYIYFTVNSTPHYLTTNGVSTTKVTYSRYDTKIWTGVLYENRNESRLDALKASVASFIDEVESKSTTSATHQIAIVTFADSGKSNNVSNGLSSNFSNLKSIVENLDADGGTYPGEAMEKANTILNSVSSDRKSSKLVVMFTDGVPAGSGWDPSNQFSANNKNEANKTIEKSKDIKSNKISYVLNEDGNYTAVGITVFSVGIFTNPFNDIVTYMDCVSSNYPEAESMDSKGTAADEQIYSFTASSAEALDEIFTSIARTATNGASSSQLNKENSDVRDFITPQFKLAEGQDVNKITVEFIPNEENTTSTTPVWLDAVPGATKGITAESGDKGADGVTPIIIKGYDFEANWVGAYKDGTAVRKWHKGGKLVINILIERDPEWEAAGVVTTNTEDSGVYYKDEKEADFKSTGINFPVPQTVNKEYAYLHIVKAGLGETESAIFDIMVGDSVINTVMVNGANPKASVKVDWLTDAAKARTIDSANPLTLADMVEFTVVERSDWSWNAPDPASITSELYEFNAAGSAEPYTFEFGSGLEKTSVAHDEESVVIKK